MGIEDGSSSDGADVAVRASGILLAKDARGCSAQGRPSPFCAQCPAVSTATRSAENVVRSLRTFEVDGIPKEMR
jgi:hypothetical protein